MLQLPLFKPDTNWTPPDTFPELQGIAAIDTETRDPGLFKLGPGWAFPGRGEIVGISVADMSGFKAYYPIRHKGGGNLPEKQVLGYIGSQLKRPELPKVFANALYDIGWFRREGLEVKGDLHDVQIAAPLLDEHRKSYSLDNLGLDYLGIGKSNDFLKQAALDYGFGKDYMANLWQLPAPIAGDYAEQDAAMTLALHLKFMKQMEEEDLLRVYGVECNLIPLLLDMRWNGVRVDLDKASRVSADLKAREKASIAEVHRITGLHIDQWVADGCAKALETIGVKCPRTPKTNQPSITAEFLESIDDPIAHHILDARKYQKAESTFVSGYILGHAVNGRIHGQFNALRSDEEGAVSGRFSSSKPNLQNIPAKDPEIGPLIRSLLLPEEGQFWAACDYSLQEPRLTVHWAYLAKCKGADIARDKYCNDPNTDYHQMVADLCGISRKHAKAINLGLAYGMGGAALCRDLGLPTDWKETTKYGMIEIAGEEGQRIIDKYHENAPFIKALMNKTETQANKVGYIRTLLGRRCHFPLINGERWYTYRSLNRLIQGSAADQTKLAMIAVYEAGHNQLVTVHDELGLSVANDNEARQVAEIMENVVQLEVPSKVDVEIGPSWGEAA